MRIRLRMSTDRHLRSGAMALPRGRGTCRARSNSLLQLFNFEFFNFAFHFVSPPFCFWVQMMATPIAQEKWDSPPEGIFGLFRNDGARRIGATLQLGRLSRTAAARHARRGSVFQISASNRTWYFICLPFLYLRASFICFRSETLSHEVGLLSCKGFSTPSWRSPDFVLGRYPIGEQLSLTNQQSSTKRTVPHRAEPEASRP
jgi:hypothetical protein